MHVYMCGRTHTCVWGRQGRKRAWGAGQCLWSKTVLSQGSQGLSLEAGGLTDLAGIRWVLGKTVTPWVLGMGIEPLYVVGVWGCTPVDAGGRQWG